MVLPSPVAAPSSTPAFLSRFPRSLSSLSLGGKKKSTEKENATISPNTSGLSDILSSSAAHQHAMAATKKKFAGSTKDLKSSMDQPPPLPQRNFTRRSQPSPTKGDGVDGEVILRRNTQVSDLDNTLNASTTACGSPSSHDNNNQPGADNRSSGYRIDKLSGDVYSQQSNLNSSNDSNASKSSKTNSDSKSVAKNKKRNKTKIKANSDPKLSTQLFLQMEKDFDKQQIIAATGYSVGNEPPPLPPRQPGMLEENQNLLNNNKFLNSGAGSGAGGIRSDSNNSRPSPNSIDTLLNYPLIATCTAVRDNLSAFPLSHRPNIVQQLQQNNSNSTHQHHVTSSVSKSSVSNLQSAITNYAYTYTHTHTHRHLRCIIAESAFDFAITIISFSFSRRNQLHYVTRHSPEQRKHKHSLTHTHTCTSSQTMYIFHGTSNRLKTVCLL